MRVKGTTVVITLTSHSPTKSLIVAMIYSLLLGMYL